MSRQIQSYAELKRQIHEDLRTQHPAWVEPTGKCPKCDEHEKRLKELLDALTQTRSEESSSSDAQTGDFDRQIRSSASNKRCA